MTLNVGDVATLTYVLTVAGTPTSATVVLTLTAPDGTTSTPTATETPTGTYTADVVGTMGGTWRYRFVASGAATDVETGSFSVAADYTTLAVLKASLGITDTDEDSALSDAITRASRAIDDLTGTTFYPVTESRLFEPTDPCDVWVDRFTDATGLVVKTGTDGTYPTTVLSTDVLPWPYNAPSKGDAYCRLRIPTGVLPCGYVRPTVQATASWGWSLIPDPVAGACLIKAARLFRRKDSPEGIAGTSDFGVVRISKYEDPDVVQLLAPYMSIGIA